MGALAGIAIALSACSDFGAAPPGPVAPDDDDDGGPAPAVDALVPFRTFPSDTVVVEGRGFGEDPGAVLFAGGTRGGDLPAAIVEWTGRRIVAIVPQAAASGDVRVRVGDVESAGAVFGVAPEISFAASIVPLFQRWGCASCHGGSGNLNVLPWSALMSGASLHGPVVVPRRSGESLIRERLLPSTPAGSRMPQGGPWLPPEEILRVADWIDQGARDN